MPTTTNKLIDLDRLSRFWDKVKTYITNHDSSIVDKIYPVGSIYMSVTDDTVASVQARFGGTWERISEGKALFGYSTTDTDFQTIGSGGGNKTVNLQHTHGFASNATVGNTTLTSAQSGVPAHAHTVPKHGHSMTQPSFSVNSSGTCTIGSSGGHSHNVVVNENTTTANLRLNNSWLTWVDGILQSGGNKSGFDGGSTRPGYVTIPSLSGGTTTVGNHTHTVPNHTHTLTRTNGSVTDKSAFDTNNNTAKNATSAHNHSLSSVTTGNGLSTTQSVMNPYITVYMYKRTA